MRQLQREIEMQGIGLHSGARVVARLKPRDEVGIVFARVDLPGAPEIAADWRHIARTTHATTLEHQGISVSTTEHLLAALWALGVTNCRIELDAPEVPILDGSAAPWCRYISEAGTVEVASERPVWGLRAPVWVQAGEASLLGLPYSGFRLSCAVDFDCSYAGPQVVDVEVSARTFETELASARTFTKAEWIEPLRAQGLIRGGSTDNAIVLGADAPSSPWRMDNELARHKALDVVGDVALLFGSNGGVLQAHLVATRAGHGLHQAWMREVLRQDALIEL